ncbi:hypothetical protein HG530_004811 [Fusarium avenaceum]|nr:hypothetical protein HG530_004811 [Fusarium avenaceum]
MIVEEHLARLDTMGEIGVIRTNMVAHLDHDINSPIFNMRAATAALQTSARLMTFIKLTFPGIDGVDDQVGNPSCQLLAKQERKRRWLTAIYLDRSIPVLWIAGGATAAQEKLDGISRNKLEILRFVNKMGPGNACQRLRPAGARPEGL